MGNGGLTMKEFNEKHIKDLQEADGFVVFVL